MTMTLEELKERLKREPELTLLEVLNISSEELVDRFADVIEDKQEQLRNDLEIEDGDDVEESD